MEFEKKYQSETDLKKQLKKAGIPIWQAAQWLGLPPTTLQSQLSPWAPLPPSNREALIKMIKKARKTVK